MYLNPDVSRLQLLEIDHATWGFSVLMHQGGASLGKVL